MKYSEDRRSQIGVVELINETYESKSELSFDDDAILCFDHQSKSPFDSAFMVSLSNEQWKNIQFAPFVDFCKSQF